MSNQINKKPRFPFAHTFSIVAMDAQTGQFGVAVQSHWFSVGSIVCYAESGVGAVATQSMTEPAYGPLGLELMRANFSASDALNSLLTPDTGRDLRQVAMIDRQGRIAAHTGARCIEYAGHILGEGFSVQANMMANSAVWLAMADAYRAAQGDFAERFLVTLEAAQAAGGDVRGKQSAAILIVAGQSSGRPWADKLVDLRVEDHPEPIQELRRLVQLHRAYSFMNQGDALMVEGKVELALAAYSAAAHIAPHIPELLFWNAVTLTEIGKVDQALPIFKQVFHQDPNLAQMLKSLPKAGLFSSDPELMNKVLSVME